MVGWREWLVLPTLGIDRIKAKIDTGARTSALHAFSVVDFQRNGRQWVRFGIHPDQYSTETEIFCESPVHDVRVVADSGGHREERYVIIADVQAGAMCFPVEMSLTSRDTMRFRMLLGRTAMRRRFMVDPSRSFLLGR